MEALRNLADDFNVRDPRKLYRLARQRDLDVTQAMAFEALKADVGRTGAGAWPRALGKSAAEGPNDRLQADLIDFSQNTRGKTKYGLHNGNSALQRDLGEDVVAQVAQHSAGVGQLGAAQVDLVVRHHLQELKDLLPAGDEARAQHVVHAEGLGWERRAARRGSPPRREIAAAAPGRSG